MANITITADSGLMDSAFGKYYAPIKMVVEERAESWEAKSLLPVLFKQEDSDNWAESFTEFTAMKGFQVGPENAEFPTDGYREGFKKTVEHEEWRDSFSISRKMIDDNKVLNMRDPKKMVKAYYRTRERFGAAMYGGAIAGKNKINFAGGVFDATTADGLPLFHTAHKNLGGGTQCNAFSDEFSEDALLYAENRMQQFTDHDGNTLDIEPDTIIIPNLPGLYKKVMRVLTSEKEPDTSNNAANTQYGRWRLIVDNDMNKFVPAGVEPWIVMDSSYNEENYGAFWLDRVKLEIKSRLTNTDANLWTGYARFTAGFNDWKAFCCGGLARGTALLPTVGG